MTGFANLCPSIVKYTGAAEAICCPQTDTVSRLLQSIFELEYASSSCLLMSTLSVFTVNEIPQMWPVKIHKETTPFWTQPRSFSSKSQNQTTVSSRQVGVVTVVVVGNSSKRLLLLRCWSGLPKSLVSQWGIYGFWHPACTGISICRGNWDELDKIFGELRKEIHEH